MRAHTYTHTNDIANIHTHRHRKKTQNSSGLYGNAEEVAATLDLPLNINRQDR